MESATFALQAVRLEAPDSGVGRLLDDTELEVAIRRAQWRPSFVPYRAGVAGRE